MRWLQGDSKLAISNPDGQSAIWPFPGLPRIKPISDVVGADSKSLKLTLEGVNLAQSAAFSIDGNDLTADQLPPGAIKILLPHEVWDPPRYAKKLEINISKPTPEWITPTEHTLTIKNPDGNTADGKYTIVAQAKATLLPAQTTSPVS